MISANLDEFSLDWVRPERKANLSAAHPAPDAFQQLCGSILGLEMELISFPTQGRDGAIDHYAYSEEIGTTIIECKKNNTVDNCLEEIRKLKEKLVTNLGTPNAPNTIYGPWFNKQFRQYIFCTSCRAANAWEYEQIIQAVNAMLQHLGALSDALSHLKEVRVKVYTWQQLKGKLEGSALLMHQWVQAGAKGIEHMVEETPYGEGYHSYLSSNKIPYSSRDHFMETHPAITDLPSETKYLDDLIGETQHYKGLIIHGQGGIGKTRLMWELALMAENRGWIAYKINAQVNFNELLALLRPDSKYILLFDYIEELPGFRDWVDSLQREHNLQVRIIANCRSSYLSNVKLRLPEQFIKLNISNTTESSRLYYLDLVNKIIQGIPMLRHLNNKIFEYRPSFAVFVRYLYDRDQREKIDLRRDEHFQNWINRRLELSLSKSGDGEQGEEIIARLFSCMPAYGAGKEFLTGRYTGIMNVLIADGWFEMRNEDSSYGQEHLAVIHDTIADEILLACLSRYDSHMRKSLVDKFFDFAAGHHLLIGCLRAFERIKDTTVLSGIQFKDMLSRAIQKHGPGMKDCYYFIAVTSLISEEARISLYFEHKDYFDPYITSPEFAGPLSFLLNDFSKKEAPEEDRQKVSRLYDWWHQPNRQSIVSNRYAPKILSTYIRFFGHNPDIQQQLEAFLKGPSTPLEASFVIGAWLETGGEKALIESHLIAWLKRFGFTRQAQFVFAAWLNAGGSHTVVQDYIMNWLQQFNPNHDAQFVYSAWLNAGGDTSLIRDRLANWLQRYVKEPHIHFVCTAWLDAQGDKKVVEGAITTWLQQYGLLKEANGLMRAWLEAGGGLVIVQDHLMTWLQHHKLVKESSFLIAAWLMSGGDKAAISQYLVSWLQQHGTDLQTQYVYNAWLKRAGGDKALVKTHLINWLKEHGSAKEAQFVLSAWLDTGGDKALVQPYLEQWLATHRTLKEAQFVYTAWLENKGHRGVVADHLLAWLQQNGSTWEATYVMSAWLNAKGDSSKVRDTMVHWLQQNGLIKEASFVLGAWLKAQGDPGIVETAMVHWLQHHDTTKDASFVIGAWLQREGNKNPVVKHLEAWLQHHDTAREAGFVLGAWLQAWGDKTIVKEHVVHWLQQYSTIPQAQLVYSGWLKTNGDKAIVKNFMVDWLQQHSSAPDASFVLTGWLQTAGDAGVVKDHLLTWLQYNITSHIASFVIAAWLQARGNKNVVKDHLLAWLQLHGRTRPSSWPIGAWLVAGGDKAFVLDYMLDWLKQFSTSFNASFVIGAWLQARGDKNLIQPYVLKWLKHYDITLEAQFIYTAWTGAGGDEAVIRAHQANWLREHDPASTAGN